MDIYVGNLPYTYGNQDLEALFSPFGQVTSARVVTDRETQRSRGFGFVTFTDEGPTQQAISEMNGTELDGRPIVVNEAKEQAPRGGGGGYRGGNNDGGGRRERW